MPLERDCLFFYLFFFWKAYRIPGVITEKLSTDGKHRRWHSSTLQPTGNTIMRDDRLLALGRGYITSRETQPAMHLDSFRGFPSVSQTSCHHPFRKVFLIWYYYLSFYTTYLQIDRRIYNFKHLKQMKIGHFNKNYIFFTKKHLFIFSFLYFNHFYQNYSFLLYLLHFC